MRERGWEPLDDGAHGVAGVTIRLFGWLAALNTRVLRLNWAHRKCVRYARSIEWSGSMFKITFCLHRRPNMSREEFQKYWLEVHGPMAVKYKDVMGFKRYVQTHALPEGSVPAVDNVPDIPAQFDGVAEIWYESQHAYETKRATPEGKSASKALYADSLKFIDVTRTPFFAGEEHVIIGD